MEFFVEFIKAFTSNLSKHTTSLLKYYSDRSKLLKRIFIKIGTVKHRSTVNLLLWNTPWRFPRKRRVFSGDTSRVEITIKPIEDEAAVDLGTKLFADFFLVTTMLSTMCYSIYLRRSRYNLILNRQNVQEEKVLSRIKYIEEELSKLLDFKSHFSDDSKNE